MYAITVDFDAEALGRLYKKASWRNAQADVRHFLEDNGFENKQGSVYFAVDDMGATDDIAVVQDLADEYDWFMPSLRDIRMLRIEENNDLMTVLDRKRRRRRT